MSGYISSFLVGPVFRQARRFQKSLSDITDITDRTEQQFTLADDAFSPTPINHCIDDTSNLNGDNTWRRQSLPSNSSIRSRTPSLSHPRNEPGVVILHTSDIDENRWSASRPASLPAQLSQDSGHGNLTTSFFAMTTPPPHDDPPSANTTVENPSVSETIQDSNNETDPNEGQDEQASPEDSGWNERGKILPADDGMTLLRRRIHDIRNSDVSSSEKARLVHIVMTENYVSSLRQFSGPHSPKLPSHEGPSTPLSIRSRQSIDRLSPTPASRNFTPSPDNPYCLKEEDLEPSYISLHISAQRSDDITSDNPGEENTEEEDTLQLGCQHYKRNVKLQCYTCKRWYTCRFCHDATEDHTLPRRETENMLCMVCKSAQPAGQWCKYCNIQAACYFCPVCKLWDDDAEKSIYHCHDCGICRIGEGIGKDYFHCKVICRLFEVYVLIILIFLDVLSVHAHIY